MKKTLIYCALAGVLSGYSAAPFSQQDDPFSEMDSALDDSSTSDADMKAEFEAWKKSHLNEYDQYKKQLMEEFEAYKKIAAEETEKYQKRLEQVWDKPETSTKKVWVDYSKDLKTKNRVDFEQQNIEITTTLDSKNTVDDTQLKQQLITLLTKNQAQAFEEDTVAQAIEKRSTEKLELIETAHVEPKPILLPLVSEKEDPSTQDVEKIVDRMIAEKKETVATNKKGEKVVTVHVAMSTPTEPEEDNSDIREAKRDARSAQSSEPREVPKKVEAQPKTPPTANESETSPAPSSSEASRSRRVTPRPMADTQVNTLPKGARLVAADVGKFATNSKLDQKLVFAIIETESAFNPMARSPIPAYGLMQIVPGSAGMDATQQLFGKGRILSPSYLYTQDKNIEIGTTYLNILYFRYLKGIKDLQSRLYCSIAAYNTGAGNVAKAFTGAMKLKPALEKINQMSPEQVYDHLVNNLPYVETQNYLKKVVARMPKYES